MQTCSLCNASSSDQDTHCKNCNAVLSEHSTTAQALKRFNGNSRVTGVTVASSYDSCSYCYEQLGTYPVDKTPLLPHNSCSHSNGCRCFYIPVLNDIFP